MSIAIDKIKPHILIVVYDVARRKSFEFAEALLKDNS